MKKKVATNAPWEETVGYSRAIRVGNVIEISGTAAVGDDGKVLGIGNVHEQTRQIILKAKRALQELGADLTHVIRTRIYVKDIDQWEAIGRAHGEFFKDIKPVTTMVEVSRFIDADLLVEIEFSAIAN